MLQQPPQYSFTTQPPVYSSPNYIPTTTLPSSSAPANPSFSSQGSSSQPGTVFPPSQTSNVYNTYGGIPYSGTGNMMTPAPAVAQIPSGNVNAPLASTSVNDLELRKRMLDHQHETELKYVDMEVDKKKKYEDKAEKHRDKAAKWKGKGVEFMTRRHENKARDFEVKAHTHQMTAEDYKMVAKKYEEERQLYNPPTEKKSEATPKPGTTDGPKPATSDATKTTSGLAPKGPSPPKTENRPQPTVISDLRGGGSSSQSSSQMANKT